jgi:hypothetical protein
MTWRQPLLKLKYDSGHSPINIYLDRPNNYLEQLVEINVKLFIVGKYNGPFSSNYRRVENITPDIYPHVFISQTKLENFDAIKGFAKDYGAKFIHWECAQVPNNAHKQVIFNLKAKEADVNIFIDSYLRDMWEFSEDSAVVIHNGINEKYGAEYNQPYVISNHIPMHYMLTGVCPIVNKTPYTVQFIKNGHNGFLFDSSAELTNLVNKITHMDKDDVHNIGENARNLVLDKFSNKNFLNDWQNLLRSII